MVLRNIMEKLANNGDGNYYYIDSPHESDRLFRNGAISMLQTLASDAKIQVEFNPDVVDRFRLLGYENRRLNKEDFEDDTVDAGEVGVGQTVTALYEIRIKDDAQDRSHSEIGTVRIRYLNLDSRQIETNEMTVYVRDLTNDFQDASPRFRFTTAVAEFAEIMKESFWAKDSNLEDVLMVAEKSFMDSELASFSRITDEREFIQMVKDAMNLRSERSESGQYG